jgi:hypothetical protein
LRYCVYRRTRSPNVRKFTVKTASDALVKPGEVLSVVASVALDATLTDVGFTLAWTPVV